jgi:hypothetical protein
VHTVVWRVHALVLWNLLPGDGVASAVDVVALPAKPLSRHAGVAVPRTGHLRRHVAGVSSAGRFMSRHMSMQALGTTQETQLDAWVALHRKRCGNDEAAAFPRRGRTGRWIRLRLGRWVTSRRTLCTTWWRAAPRLAPRAPPHTVPPAPPSGARPRLLTPSHRAARCSKTLPSSSSPLNTQCRRYAETVAHRNAADAGFRS